MSNFTTQYSNETPPDLQRVIENLIHSGRRVRVFYGDKNTGQDWCEEWMVMGYIGRSTGTRPIPLLVNNSRSSGGPALMDSSIVKITERGRVLYKHPRYYCPAHSMGPVHDRGYMEAVYRDGELVAQFKKFGQAQRYIDYIEGRRDSK